MGNHPTNQKIAAGSAHPLMAEKTHLVNCVLWLRMWICVSTTAAPSCFTSTPSHAEC